MKKWIFATLLFGAAIFTYFGCQKDSALGSVDDLNVKTEAVRLNVDLGETFTVQYGNVVTVEPDGFTLFFRDVKEDSRCPATVNCIWEGRAVLEIELEGLDEFQIVELETLNSRNEEGNVVNFMGHSIKLLKVTPYPESVNSIPPKLYEATFELGRAEAEIGDDF